MKLQIEIDAPEDEIRECVESIPPDWFTHPNASPIRMMAMAMYKAWKHARKTNPRKKEN